MTPTRRTFLTGLLALPVVAWFTRGKRGLDYIKLDSVESNIRFPVELPPGGWTIAMAMDICGTDPVHYISHQDSARLDVYRKQSA